jgi:xanthine dehydrogenase YagT iron-sulfur-binding subunit
MNGSDDMHDKPDSNVSRRSFLKGTGLVLSVPLVESGVRAVTIQGEQVKIYGPDKTPVSLNINGAVRNASVEPRTTLLDTLRIELDMTGAKRVCDRATCGACTVIMDGKPVYSCSVLAIDAQGHKITTVEGLVENGKLHPVQQAFVDNDAQQCGFCTPGFVVACKAFLDKNPKPSPAEVERGLGGNLCRCGTYMGIRAAVAQASQVMEKGGRRG